MSLRSEFFFLSWFVVVLQLHGPVNSQQSQILDEEFEPSATTVNGLPQFWYSGTWPFCSGSEAKCEQFGFKMAEISKRGDGGLPCLAGYKVLCQAKDLELRPVVKSPKDTLNVMSYNIYDITYFATRMGQRERTCRIPGELYRQYPETDVLMIQELFMEGCMSHTNFRQLMSFYGWPHSTKTLGNKALISGGVAIFSKYPLRDTEYRFFYTKSITKLDVFSPKGFVYANFEKDGRRYHILSTHFQAWDGKHLDQVRLAQGRQIGNFLDNKNIPEQDAVILGGDLNCDYRKFTETAHLLFTVLNMNLPPISSQLNYTFDPYLNNVVSYKEDPAWYDYILVRKGNLQPLTGTLETFQFQSEDSFKVCIQPSILPFYIPPDSAICGATQFINDLSDHFPVYAKLTFPPVLSEVTASDEIPSSTTSAPIEGAYISNAQEQAENNPSDFEDMDELEYSFPAS